MRDRWYDIESLARDLVSQTLYHRISSDVWDRVAGRIDFTGFFTQAASSQVYAATDHALAQWDKPLTGAT